MNPILNKGVVFVPSISLRAIVSQLRIGPAVAFGPNGEPSAIDKQPLEGDIAITRLGLAGDQQGDTRIHGGPLKAIHHFPKEHYASLRQQLADFNGEIGGFGENISTCGIIERDICLGDIFSFGTAKLAVSQGRQPCWKLNIRFAQPQMARLVQQTGCTGWYYQVLEPGVASAGDSLVLLERPYPEANLAKIQHSLHCNTLDFAQLEQLLAIPVLPNSWRKVFSRRLETRQQESDEKRTQTPAKKMP